MLLLSIALKSRFKEELVQGVMMDGIMKENNMMNVITGDGPVNILKNLFVFTSPLLRGLITCSCCVDCRPPILILPWATSSALHKLQKYLLNSGEIQVADNELDEVLQAAQLLGLKAEVVQIDNRLEEDDIETENNDVETVDSDSNNNNYENRDNNNLDEVLQTAKLIGSESVIVKSEDMSVENEITIENFDLETVRVSDTDDIIYAYHENENMSPLKISDAKSMEGSIFGEVTNNFQHSIYPVTESVSNVWIETNQNNLFECSSCGYSSNQKGHVKRHISSKHEKNLIPCPECNETFTYVESMRRHLKTHHSHENKPFSCPHCKFVTNRHANLQYHISCKHEMKRHDCDKCNYSCITEKLLKNHIQKEHQGFSLECSKCDYKTADSSSMLYHRKVKHEGFMVSCKFCPKSFTKQSTLNKHVLHKHQ